MKHLSTCAFLRYDKCKCFTWSLIEIFTLYRLIFCKLRRKYENRGINTFVYIKCTKTFRTNSHEKWPIHVYNFYSFSLGVMFLVLIKNLSMKEKLSYQKFDMKLSTIFYWTAIQYISKINIYLKHLSRNSLFTAGLLPFQGRGSCNTFTAWIREP